MKAGRSIHEVTVDSLDIIWLSLEEKSSFDFLANIKSLVTAVDVVQIKRLIYTSVFKS